MVNGIVSFSVIQTRFPELKAPIHYMQACTLEQIVSFNGILIHESSLMCYQSSLPGVNEIRTQVYGHV